MISTVGPLAVALYIICSLNTINLTPDNHSCSTTCPAVPYTQYEVPFWMCIIDRKATHTHLLYLDDDTSGPHCLSLANYNAIADNDAPNHMWIMIDPSP